MTDCPFCGIDLEPKYDGLQHPYRTRSDAGEEPLCYMNGTFLGKERVEAFRRRATPNAIRMQVVEGRPQFSSTEGDPVGPEMLNQIVAYYNGLLSG